MKNDDKNMPSLQENPWNKICKLKCNWIGDKLSWLKVTKLVELGLDFCTINRIYFVTYYVCHLCHQ